MPLQDFVFFLTTEITIIMAPDSISSLLFSYLIQKKSMTVPGFGSFFVERLPAKNDFASKQFLPPSYSVAFDPEQLNVPDHQLEFLAFRTGKTAEQVKDQLSAWGQKLAARIQNSTKLTWPSLGDFTVGAEGNILYSPVALPAVGNPVGFTHVLRENIEHSLQVGEEEMSNTEMELFLEEQRDAHKTDTWRSASVILLILIILLLGYRFTLGSFDLKSPRLSPIHPAPIYPSYRII
jgi:hypothetical protein